MASETYGIATGDTAPDGSASIHFDARRVLNQRDDGLENADS